MKNKLALLAFLVLVPIAASANNLLLRPFAGRTDYFMHYTGSATAAYAGYHILKRYTDNALIISAGAVLLTGLVKELVVDDRFCWGDMAYNSAGVLTATITIRL